MGIGAGGRFRHGGGRVATAGSAGRLLAWQVPGDQCSVCPICGGDAVSGERAWRSTFTPGKESHPVVNVSWEDAMAFCKWALAPPPRAGAEGGCRRWPGLCTVVEIPATARLIETRSVSEDNPCSGPRSRFGLRSDQCAIRPGPERGRRCDLFQAGLARRGRVDGDLR